MAVFRGRRRTSPTRSRPVSDKKTAAADRRLHGRHKGKRLRPGQQALLDSLLPRLRIDPAAHAPGTLDPYTLFPAVDPDAVWLEIGYGGGEHLLAQAAANPRAGLIGCEFFTNGVAKLLRRIDDDGLGNIRLYDHDARTLIDTLAPASIDRAFLLFPDPWPKTRHHKRRFVQTGTVDALARVLKPGAEWRIASDIPDYVRWTLWHMIRTRDFVWVDERPGDWRVRRADWPGTRYEAKALREGRVPSFLTFRRR